MPDELTVEPVSHTLNGLEDAILTPHDIIAPNAECIFGGVKPFSEPARYLIPLLGMEYTLSLYFPTKELRLTNITEVRMPRMNLTGIPTRPTPLRVVVPHWISHLPHLKHLHVDNNHICYLPRWLVRRRLVTLEAHDNPCENQYPQNPTTLRGLAASRIRKFIDEGGDWTFLNELPSHFVAMILMATPYVEEVQPLWFRKVTQTAFIVEKVEDEDLKGTEWERYQPTSTSITFADLRRALSTA